MFSKNSCLFLYILEVYGLMLTSSSTNAQMPDPSQLPPALRNLFLTISSHLNETLFPSNSTLAESDPSLFAALTNLQQASVPALKIISNTTIPNNTWVTYNDIKAFNQIGIDVVELLSDRILTPHKFLYRWN